MSKRRYRAGYRKQPRPKAKPLNIALNTFSLSAFPVGITYMCYWLGGEWWF